MIFRSRDATRAHDVHNGVTLCRHHHAWVHANARQARERYGLAGHATDVVHNGRVVMEPIEAATGMVPLRTAIQEELARLAAMRPRGHAFGTVPPDGTDEV